MADLTKLQTINFGWSSTTRTFLAVSGDYVVAYAYSKGLFLYKRVGDSLQYLATYLSGDSTCTCADWRGNYLAVGKTNGLLFFKLDGDALVQLTSPSNPTYSNLAHVAWDEAGDYLMTGASGTSSVRCALYRRDGDTLARVVSSVSIGGGPCRGLSWNGAYIAIARYVYSAPNYYYLTVGKRTGNTVAEVQSLISTDVMQSYSVAWLGSKLFLGVNNDIKSFIFSSETLTNEANEKDIGANPRAIKWRSGSHVAVAASVGQKVLAYPYGSGFGAEIALSSPPNGNVSSLGWMGGYLLATVTDPMEMVLYSLDESVEVAISCNTPPPVVGIGLFHEPPNSIEIAATTPAPGPDLTLRHAQPIRIGITAETPAPGAALTLSFFPASKIGLAATTPPPGPAMLRVFHDWGATQLATTPIYILEISAPGKTTERIPIRSFQGRLRNGTPSYLQVIVPNAPRYAGTIADRQAGQIAIFSGVRVAGQELLEEIARVNIGLLADQRGGNSQTITISGHGTTTNEAPKTRVLQGITYRASGSGQRRYRCRLDRFLRPGDTAVAEQYGESIVVGLITYVVDTTQTTMEIAEAVVD